MERQRAQDLRSPFVGRLCYLRSDEPCTWRPSSSFWRAAFRRRVLSASRSQRRHPRAGGASPMGATRGTAAEGQHQSRCEATPQIPVFVGPGEASGQCRREPGPIGIAARNYLTESQTRLIVVARRSKEKSAACGFRVPSRCISKWSWLIPSSRTLISWARRIESFEARLSGVDA